MHEQLEPALPQDGLGMSRLLNLAVNALWLLRCTREGLANRFQRGHVVSIQARVLLDMVRKNENSKFGQQHGFSHIRSVATYRRNVPLSVWEDYAPLVDRLAAGERHVLTEEPVIRFLPTAGSLAGPKLVPYTRGLARQFSRGIDPWVFNLFRWRPSMIAGCAFFSITPFGAAASNTPSGIPVGFESDSVYLGSIMNRLEETVLAVPDIVASIADPAAYRYVSLLFLLRREDLALVSVWNPTLLEILLRSMAEWSQALTSDVESGSVTPPAALDPGVRENCRRKLYPNARRARKLRTVFDTWHQLDPRSPDQSGRTLYEALWPHLRVISCWADANAETPARRLKELFPHVDIQPKGLLSTEGFVSFPLGGTGKVVLSTRSHFFEFIETGGNEKTPLLAHELVPGHRYEVVISTAGGLYRYRTRDLVEVTGFWGSAPTIRFIGRADMVCDLFGEKLAETHVRAVVEATLEAVGIAADFWMVAPERCVDGRGFYTLFMQPSSSENGSEMCESLIRTAQRVEVGLRANPQYVHCIRLGQLEPLRVFRIENGAAEDYLSACMARGQRLGEIKPPALHRETGWSEVFRGRFVA
jgi:hypothetical protein